MSGATDPVFTEAMGSPVQAISPDALIALRTDMLKFARLQVRNAEVAEDMVQGAMEAALKQTSTFEGRSTLKTWVFSILRNHIIDHFRQAARTVPVSSLLEDDEAWLERQDAMFSEKGTWRESFRPQTWPAPEECMQSQQFWRVLETCLELLPPQMGRVFMMREFLGFDSEEICAQLGISSTNLHVILHRARKKLRGCMETGWGRPGEASC
jgi:RNA polymerase sigma-70 factor, ECF subfamily